MRLIDDPNGDSVEFFTPNEKTLLRGYRQCQEDCRDAFGEFNWLFSGLSSQQKFGVWAVMSFAMRCWRLLMLDQNDEERDEILAQWRRENADWFQGKFRSARLVALLDTTTRFGISEQHLLSMLRAVEQWLRDRQFADRQSVDEFTSRLGGAAVRCLLTIFGVDDEHGSPDSHESRASLDGSADHRTAHQDGVAFAAEAIGRLLAKTHMLTHFATNLKRGRVFLPAEELRDYRVRTSDLCMGKVDGDFAELVQRFVRRAENDMWSNLEHLQPVATDGKRIIKSVLAMATRLLDQIQQEPGQVVRKRVELTTGEQFKFQLKHLLGMEGGKRFKSLDASDH